MRSKAARSPRLSRKPSAGRGQRETPSGRRSATGTELGLRLVAALAPEAHDPLTSVGRRPWLVTCSCGWERECSSEWAAQSVSKRHQKLGSAGVEHVTRIDGPSAPTDGGQLTLG